MSLNADSHNTSEGKAPWRLGMVLTGPFAAFGRAAIGWTNNLGAAAVFLFLALLKIPRPKQLAKVVQQVYYIGARSTLIIMLIGLFTGMVLGLQSYHALVKFGAQGALGTLVALSLVREMGPVLTAIMITARAGSAITAEIGIQRISEQIDALDTMRIDPLRYLISPRIAAAIISFPLLTALFDLIGIIGGYISGVLLLGANAGTYFYRVQASMEMKDITDGFDQGDCICRDRLHRLLLSGLFRPPARGRPRRQGGRSRDNLGRRAFLRPYFGVGLRRYLIAHLTKDRPMDTPLIEFKDVTKRFGSKTVLDSVNLQINEGEVTTIIGLSGSGKSVLLKHIIGLIEPDAGTILFRGKPLAEMKKKEMAASLAQISYMFQDNALFDSLTVYENIALPLRETTNLGKAEIDRRVVARMEQTELSDAAQKYPSELSGGMQKRAALARALVTDPRIVLFDEPTSGQDPVRKNAILSMIAQYQRKFGFTAILVSHEIPDVYFISNRILALYDRKIVFQGTPEELEDFDHPFKDEVIRSLEGFQEELTGLYSKRQFKVLNHAQLKRRTQGETYSIAVFTMEELSAIIANLGHDAAQEAIRQMGLFIDKHFSDIGGFSTRTQTNEFVTVLPYSDLAEAGSILNDFVKDFEAAGNPGHLGRNPQASRFGGVRRIRDTRRDRPGPADRGDRAHHRFGTTSAKRDRPVSVRQEVASE